MSGTNFRSGVATRTKYAGGLDSNSQPDGSQVGADTKFIRKTAVIRCDAQTSETTTGFTFPASAIVHDVFLNVITVDATETVDVGTAGTSNDPDGFLDGASLATAGIVVGSLADGAVTRGALLNEVTEATTAAARVPYAIGADPVTYTCSAGSDTAVFDIIIDYTEVVTEAQ